ncbi:hypothetical protein RCC89_01795 [Cytophagaceae bacterium ABcell3]|nr:hypothetical protein RCC89_01795 [Cytophagaceae bacterium ABcell3]
MKKLALMLFPLASMMFSCEEKSESEKFADEVNKSAKEVKESMEKAADESEKESKKLLDKVKK